MAVWLVVSWLCCAVWLRWRHQTAAVGGRRQKKSGVRFVLRVPRAGGAGESSTARHTVAPTNFTDLESAAHDKTPSTSSGHSGQSDDGLAVDAPQDAKDEDDDEVRAAHRENLSLAQESARLEQAAAKSLRPRGRCGESIASAEARFAQLSWLSNSIHHMQDTETTEKRVQGRLSAARARARARVGGTQDQPHVVAAEGPSVASPQQRGLVGVYKLGYTC